MYTEEQIKALEDRNKQLEAINAEIAAERATAKEQLKAYKEAEAKAEAERLEAEKAAELEKIIQERVAAELAKQDSLGTVKIITETKPTEETVVDETDRTEEDVNIEVKSQKYANALRGL